MVDIDKLIGSSLNVWTLLPQATDPSLLQLTKHSVLVLISNCIE